MPEDHAVSPDPDKINRAIAGYDMIGTCLALLGRSVDDGGARNYAALTIELDGFNLPFDRAEIHFVRPKGLTPTERAEFLQVMVDEARMKIFSLERSLVGARRTAREPPSLENQRNCFDGGARALSLAKALHAHVRKLLEILDEVGGYMPDGHQAAIRAAREAVMRG